MKAGGDVLEPPPTARQPPPHSRRPPRGGESWPVPHARRGAPWYRRGRSPRPGGGARTGPRGAGTAKRRTPAAPPDDTRAASRPGPVTSEPSARGHAPPRGRWSVEQAPRLAGCPDGPTRHRGPTLGHGQLGAHLGASPRRRTAWAPARRRPTTPATRAARRGCWPRGENTTGAWRSRPVRLRKQETRPRPGTLQGKRESARSCQGPPTAPASAHLRRRPDEGRSLIGLRRK